MAKDKLSSTAYEQLAQSIYQSILTLEGVSDVQVLHNKKVRGKSGTEHQIDVLWEFRQAGVTHKVLVECKQFASTIELGHVRNFHSVVEDVGDARGIMITTIGYQQGAQKFAEHQRIGLKILRPPDVSDWEGRIKNIVLKVNIRMLSVDNPVEISLENFTVRDQAQAERLKTARLNEAT